MTTKGTKVTGPEVAEPQVLAKDGGIVPATPLSSSHVGLATGCDAGPAADLATADNYGETVVEGRVDPGGPSLATAGDGQTPAPKVSYDSGASGRSTKVDRPGPLSSKKREQAKEERTRKRELEVERRKAGDPRSSAASGMSSTTDDEVSSDILGDVETESAGGLPRTPGTRSIRRRTLRFPEELGNIGGASDPTTSASEQTKAQGASAKKQPANKSRATPVFSDGATKLAHAQ